MDLNVGTDLGQLTCENAKLIAPINKDVVHRICSGQVVLSLAIAVKELVENALDAGATLVEVRLKEYGIDLVEVSDNGGGVVEENFAALTLKYHTSKLRNFSDLIGITSFGFRGEALSSLCALSDLSITTRHKSSEYATKIVYDHKGEIKQTTPCSRQIGTTVTLLNLFETLPVRQKEFHKNIKREFAKMTQILYAYCLISTDVKIICSNQTKKGTKSVVVATEGSKSIKDNISCVFGVKQLESLMELKFHNPNSYIPNLKEKLLVNPVKEVSQNPVATNDLDDIQNETVDLSEDSGDAIYQETQITQETETQITQETFETSSLSLTPESQEPCRKKSKEDFNFTGFVSSCSHGCGRSTTDRQFYYVNSRPCEPNKIMKLVNEIYRQYNQNQYPFVFLNLRMKGLSVDVNVTPDKRRVFMDKEKYLLEVLKVSLLKIYQNIPSTLKVENSTVNGKNNKIENYNSVPKLSSFLSKFASRSGNVGTNEVAPSNGQDTEKKRKLKTLDSFVSLNKISKMENNDTDVEKQINNNIIKNKEIEMNDTEDKQQINNKIIKTKDVKIDEMKLGNKYLFTKETGMIQMNEEIKNETLPDESTFKLNKQSVNQTKSEKSETNNENVVYLSFGDNIPNTQIRTVEEVIMNNQNCKKHKPANNESLQSSEKKINTTHKSKNVDCGDPTNEQKKTVNLKTSIEHIKSLISNSKEENNRELEKVKFKATIGSGNNKTCEQELQKELSKEMFQKMRIIGQFNLGFIITELDNDLFIIDQHATDEKYNFETLQITTVLTNQKLVIPQQLELTGVNEQILMEHLEIFKKNGFTFEIDENAPPTKKVKLLTIPISNNWIFGKDDIEELLFMLKECEPTETCRPSRVRAMFASRACRKSVMIGKNLSMAHMRKLVDHMGMIEQPWNCPHGRPTIRHLINLALT